MSSSNINHIAICSVFSLLAACGGGGGGGGGSTLTTPPITGLAIDASNQKAAAAAGAQSISDALSGADAYGGVSALAPTTVPSGGAVALALARDAVFKTAQRIGRLATQSAPQPILLNCQDGGTQSTTFNDANGNLQFDAGDSVTYVYAGCKQGTATTNGSLVLTFQQYQDDGQNISLKATAAFTNYSTVDTADAGASFRVDGSLNLSSSGAHGSGEPVEGTCNAGKTDATFSQIIVSHLGTDGSVRRTTTFKDGSVAQQIGVDCSSALAVSESATGSWTGISGTLAIATPLTILTGANGRPYAGAYTVGADRGKVLVSFTNGGASQVQLDANGDGTYEASTSLTWADLGVD